MYLTAQQVADRYSVTKATIWRWVRTDPTFPRPVKFSEQATRFELSALEAWETTRRAA